MKIMLKKIAAIPFALSLLFAGSLFFSQPASADDDRWGFSLGGNGLGFYYDDDNRHHHRHHGHWGHGHHRYYSPYRYYGHRNYYRPYYRSYTPYYYYPGGLSFHFD